jgi:ParB family transcriptional regulator, chromosome partitioning protein
MSTVSSRNQTTTLPLLREIICARCQQPMAPRIYPGTPKLFCSARCRVAANRETRRIMRPNEFYTPAHVIEAARACMGGIDLDPASCALANKTVRATHFYSLKDDGMKRPWFGKVWLNPPYGKFWPGFVARCVGEWKAGRIEQAIILLRARHITSRVFHDSLGGDYALCIPHTRVNFTSPNFNTSSNTDGSVFMGVGVSRQRFGEVFGEFGRVTFIGGEP